MKNSIIIFALLFTLFSSNLFSQSTGSESQKWGFEADLIQPFLPEIGIITIASRCAFVIRGSKSPLEWSINPK